MDTNGLKDCSNSLKKNDSVELLPAVFLSGHLVIKIIRSYIGIL
ncbi:hypothetical protein PAESOLCIP111_06676 [Paenibacillus solanacearum]|uniref:Uncharacterized protein n=1 Tax=Paenibacillus solanacearum TaxID=2048548 RepID=A0A916NZ00_9BACL|nr:hypothetical protein PAESOLCIP111_06676 [Paenibacillus solanacearum]